MFVRQRTEKDPGSVTQEQREKARSYYLANREKYLIRRKERYMRDKTYELRYQTYAMATNIEQRWERTIRCRFSNLGIKPCRENLGCSFSEFAQYIKDNMKRGMTLSNYGNKRGQWSIFLDSTDDFSYYNWKPMFKQEQRKRIRERNEA